MEDAAQSETLTPQIRSHRHALSALQLKSALTCCRWKQSAILLSAEKVLPATGNAPREDKKAVNENRSPLAYVRAFIPPTVKPTLLHAPLDPDWRSCSEQRQLSGSLSAVLKALHTGYGCNSPCWKGSSE